MSPQINNIIPQPNVLPMPPSPKGKCSCGSICFWSNGAEYRCCSCGKVATKKQNTQGQPRENHPV